MKRITLVMLTIIICFFTTGCNDKNEQDNNQNVGNNNVVQDNDEVIEKIIIEFDSDGGTEVESIEINKNETIVSPEEPIREGYVFLGWYYEEELFDFSVSPEENIILKAKWQEKVEKTYVITFNANGGSNIEKQIIKENEKIQEPQAPVKTGFIFLYWEYNKKEFNFESEIVEDMTLVAKWKNVWDVKDTAFKKYGNNAFRIHQCYTEKSYLANDPKLVGRVNVGDRIVCTTNYETNAKDKVMTMKFTLAYGKGLKLVKSEDVELATKDGNTYLFNFKKADSVGNFGTFTFEIVDTKDLTYGIKDIKFITEDNKYYYSGNDTDSFDYIWDVSDATFKDYGRDAFFMHHCYNEESELPGRVSIGDKITCRPGYETNGGDAVKTMKFTLVYGKGLKLIKTEDMGSATKDGNTYLFNFKEPDSVGGFGTYTFEVVDTKDLTYGIKDIKFITEDNKYYYSGDDTSSFTHVWDVSDSSFEEYSDDAFFMYHCYTEESVLTNNFKKVESVNLGDRIVCQTGYETNSKDPVKTFKYTLVYGKGLKLVETNELSTAIKNENTYLVTLDKANRDSVGRFGTFTFEVVDTKDLTYGIKDIKFITNDNRYYYSHDNINSLNYVWDVEDTMFTKYKIDSFEMKHCYTEESVLANKYKKVESVNLGDRIVCFAGYETYSTDLVKTFKYTLTYGSGLKLIKSKASPTTQNGNNYLVTLDNPTSVLGGFNSFTFEVVDTKNLTYGIKDIKFITEDNKYYYSSDDINSLNA